MGMTSTGYRAAAGLLLVGCAFSAAPAMAGSTTRYQGRTAQGKTIIVIASKKRVTTENLVYQSKCVGGNRAGGTGFWGMNVDYVDRPKLWTLHNGHFNGTYEDTRMTAQRSFTFAGTIGAHKAHGTYRLKVVDGAETCDTGVVKWSAKPKKARF